MVGEEQVSLEHRGQVAIISLNRPLSINALNMAMREQLVHILGSLSRDQSVAVLVIRGAGERGFCAGADIKEVRPAITAVGERDRLMPTSWIDSVGEFPKPIVAAIHGVCMGAGLELALACDIRVCAKGSRFCFPEAKLGLIPGGGGTQRLSRLVGVGRALDMILTGEEMDSESAIKFGLVSRLGETKEDAIGEAIKIGEALAEVPEIALRYAKEAVMSGVDLPLSAGLALEKSLFAILAEARANKQQAHQID